MLRTNQACEMVDETNSNPEGTALFYFQTGSNWIAMKEYEKSLNCFKISLGICLSVDLDVFKHFKKGHVAIMFACIVFCLLKLEQYKESLIYLKTAAEMVLKDDIMTEIISPKSALQSIEKYLIKKEYMEKTMPRLLLAFLSEENNNENVNADSDLIQTQTSLGSFVVDYMIKELKLFVHTI